MMNLFQLGKLSIFLIVWLKAMTGVLADDPPRTPVEQMKYELSFALKSPNVVISPSHLWLWARALEKPEEVVNAIGEAVQRLELSEDGLLGANNAVYLLYLIPHESSLKELDSLYSKQWHGNYSTFLRKGIVERCPDGGKATSWLLPSVPEVRKFEEVLAKVENEKASRLKQLTQWLLAEDDREVLSVGLRQLSFYSQEPLAEDLVVVFRQAELSEYEIQVAKRKIEINQIADRSQQIVAVLTWLKEMVEKMDQAPLMSEYTVRQTLVEDYLLGNHLGRTNYPRTPELRDRLKEVATLAEKKKRELQNQKNSLKGAAALDPRLLSAIFDLHKIQEECNNLLQMPPPKEKTP